MYWKIRIYLMALILLTGSVVVIGFGDSSGLPSTDYTPPSTAWNGYVTILPDGSLSNTGAPILQSGNYYNLTGNIFGTLTVNREGAVVNGNGFTVWNTAAIPPVKLANANGITLENMTISAWYSTAVNIVSSSYDLINNNTINAMVTGIFVYSPFNTISGNLINVSLSDPSYSGQSSGVIVKASSSVVSDNTILMSQHGNGLNIEAGLSQIQGNNITLFTSNSQGIVINGASNNLGQNMIQGTGSDSTGIDLLLGTQSTTVSSNNITMDGQRSSGITALDGFNFITNNNVILVGSYTHGVSLLSSGTGSNSVKWNNINVSGYSAIGIYDTSQGTAIDYNTIIVNGSYSRGITCVNNLQVSQNQIWVTGDYTYGLATPDGNITENIIATSGNYTYGIYSWGGQSALFAGNMVNASGSHAYGILLNGQYQTVSGNTFQAGYDNGTGFMADSLIHSLVANNSIIFSSTGIKITTYTSYDLTFQGNELLNDTEAFTIVGVSSNLFYHNSFINYTSYAITGSGSATWDNGYPSGGNFWSGYSGTDIYSGVSQNITGSDGIGDTQFNLTANNIDHYPLMGQWKHPKVTFVETGLAGGTGWSVNFSGSLQFSTSSSISFPVSLATYSTYGFSIPDVPGYTHSDKTGSVNYVGDSITVQVAFVSIPEPSYTVAFTQNGLPGGTEWSVTLGSSTVKTTGSTISFDPVNGSYSYSVAGVAGYSADSYNGTVVVNGHDVGVTVAFTQVAYSVSFSTLGLPSGMAWYVNLSNGKSFSSTGSDLMFYLPNGSYSYTVDNVSNYNSTPASGTFSVSGHSPANIQISFNASAAPEPPAGTGFNIWPYIIGAIIGAAVTGVIVAVVYYFRWR